MEAVIIPEEIEHFRSQGMYPDADGNLRNQQGQVVVQMNATSPFPIPEVRRTGTSRLRLEGGKIVKELRTHQYDGFTETNAIMDAGADEIERLRGTLAAIRQKLEFIVCTEGCDAGVVMLDINGTTHTEIIDGKPIQVYDNEYFSPLGDALMELYRIASGSDI